MVETSVTPIPLDEVKNCKNMKEVMDKVAQIASISEDEST